MNIRNLLRTYDLIEKDVQSGRNKFDQAMWAHECGTPACVAGHAAVACGYTLVTRMADNWRVGAEEGYKRKTWAIPSGEALSSKLLRPDLKNDVYFNVYFVAKKVLDLTTDQARKMFYTGSRAGAYDAMAMLRHCIEHDEVRWPTLEDDDE